jgi:hypothetical protein
MKEIDTKIGRRPKTAAARTGTGEREAGAKERPGRTGGDGHQKTGSDTMLGIDKLYYLGAKGHNI